jgi:hypothetical protein
MGRRLLVPGRRQRRALPPAGLDCREAFGRLLQPERHGEHVRPEREHKTIVGLDDQAFTLPQSGRVVFHTVIEAKIFGLFQANATGVGLTVEILNSSNAVVARSTNLS